MAETHSFQAEVSRLLSIVAHALYSEREVFLRELISNASDACDRLRYAALTTPDLLPPETVLKVTLTPDKAAKSLTIADNGIGMNRDELIANLGTIARSGTADFLEKMTKDKLGDKSGAPQLIGQFGVGFYAAFMVADMVTVLSRKAGESQGYRWTSDGKGDFTVEDAAVDFPHGTRITLTLKDDALEFLEEARLKDVVTRYSDHIAFPIVVPAGAGSDDAEMERTLNSASALWLKPPKDITPEHYKEFYHHAGHAFDDPWLTLHWHAEGVLDYRALLFIPSTKPFDLFDPQRRNQLKLYVRRVFITQAVEGLLPPYLRFMRGIVDSEDLPLNISREMLQNNPVLDKIKAGLTKRVLGDLVKAARDNPEYNSFWDNFGAVVKEGLYEDRTHTDLILKLCRFHTTTTIETDGLMIGLETYAARMKEGQKQIYFISGNDRAALASSPQLEGFKARGIEVLLMTDPVDDFWPNAVQKFGETPLQSVTRGAPDELDSIAPTEKKDAETPAGDVAELVALLKATLGEAVSDVRESRRMTTSAVCLVAGDSDIDINLERLLRAHKQAPEGLRRVLEINPRHPLIRQLADKARAGATDMADMAHLLLDQARIIEGEPLPDPVGFASRMAHMLEKGLAA